MSSMARRPVVILAALLAVTLAAALTLAPAARATDSNVISVNSLAANSMTTVSLTVAGIPLINQTADLNPEDLTQQGAVEHSESTDSLTIPALGTVVSEQTLTTEDVIDNLNSGVNEVGDLTDTGSYSLLNGLVTANGLEGGIFCTATQGQGTTPCDAGASVAALSVAGQPVTIPAQPIPVNDQVASVLAHVTATVLGIKVNIPVTVDAVLNYFHVAGNGTTAPQVNSATIDVQVSGSINVAGLGLVSLNVTSQDQDLIEYALMAGFVAVAAGAIMPGVQAEITTAFKQVQG